MAHKRKTDRPGPRDGPMETCLRVLREHPDGLPRSELLRAMYGNLAVGQQAACLTAIVRRINTSASDRTKDGEVVVIHDPVVQLIFEP